LPEGQGKKTYLPVYDLKGRVEEGNWHRGYFLGHHKAEDGSEKIAIEVKVSFPP